MAAIPETSLSSPLTEVAYVSFLRVYSHSCLPNRSEVERAAASLLLTTGAPSSELVDRHRPQMTPSLTRLGEKEIEEELATMRLRSMQELVSEQEVSIRASFAELSRGSQDKIPEFNFVHSFLRPSIILELRRTLYWLNAVDKIVESSRRKRWVRWRGGWFSRRLSLVPHSGRYVLLTTDACLMLKDMLYSRFIVRLYCAIDPLRSSLPSVMTSFLDWGEEVLVQLGNGGYEVIKGIEALSQTEIIKREENILDGRGQHRAMIDKYKEKEIRLGGTGGLVTRLELILSGIPTSRDVAETFGFMKFLGHPYVDPVAGCATVKKLAQADLNLDPASCLQLEWSFCHLYCRGYLAKTGHWPPMEFVPRWDGTPTQLEGLVLKNHPSLAFGFTQYPASDWQWARFKPHLLFDEGEDILSLISDRAIAYPRSHFDSTWAGSLPYRPPKSPTSGKALEELLRRPGFDLKDVVSRVSSGSIPHDWRIVAVSPKEREMKLNPRMFSMMTLEMRFFFVLTEHNIATGVFRYIPEQTMTMSRQELLGEFLRSTRPDRGRWITAILGIDFSTWNTLWRNESVKPIGQRIDQMYGTVGVFSCVHDFFSSCLCMLKSGEYPPKGLTSSNRRNPPESDSLWYNHLGGFEGIAQKLWTSCTVALVHMCLWPLGLSYRILGQGDNQVVVMNCYLPPSVQAEDVPPYIQAVVDRASLNLATISAKVGQKVKPEECIYSTCFLTYGKEMILNGAYLPTVLKYISRLFPSTTSDAPSVYEMFSSISSGATGATDRGEWTLPIYYLAKSIECLTFQRELTRSLLHRDRINKEVTLLLGKEDPLSSDVLRKDLLRLLLAVPSNLGGLPITLLPELMYRGHSDPLSSSLGHLCLLHRVPGVDRYRQVLLKGWLFQADPDVTGLILDPYALPLQGVSPPSTVVARLTSNILPEITRNHQFTELFARASLADREHLIAYLRSMRPYYPKIAHDIYKSTLVGLRDSFARRFSNTRTLLSIGAKAEIDIVGASIDADLRGIKRILTNYSLIWKVDTQSPSFSMTEVYRVAELLRRTWLRGEKLEGVTTMFPLASGTLNWIPGPIPPKLSRPIIVGMSLTSSSEECRSTRGPVHPYLGSATGEKAVEKWVRPSNTSPPLKDVLKLLTIREMVSVPGSHLHTGLTRLAMSRSLLDVADLEALLKVRIGGTIAHRYRTGDDARGTYWNSCFNWPSHITFSTNLSGDLGRRDYPFDYQAAMLTIGTLMSWVGTGTPLRAPWGLSLEVDLARMDEVADAVVESGPWTAPLLPPASNYYASVIEVRLSPNALSSARLTQGSLRLPGARSVPPLAVALCHLLLTHLRKSHPVTTRYGHTIGLAQPQRVIDLPELGLLRLSEMTTGLIWAFWLKIGLNLALLCGWKERRPLPLLHTLLDLEVRRGIPSLAGTLREVAGGVLPGTLGPGLGRESENRTLAAWMHLVHTEGKKMTDRIPFHLFEMGGPSVSSSLSAYLGLVAARECLSGDRPRYNQGKVIARLVKKCLERPAETDRVRLLCVLARALEVNKLFTVSQESPEEVVRRVRNRLSDPSFDVHADGDTGLDSPVVFATYSAPRVEGKAEGGVSQLAYSPPVLLPDILVESWLGRSPVVPAAAERWAPLASLHANVRSVLLVGVGDGYIGSALPRSWHVTGVELGSQLQPLGHSFTTYQPPGLTGRFTLHPASWTSTGDITDREVMDVLDDEIKDKKYELVILDVERVSTLHRLELRTYLARHRVPVYCRVLISLDDANEFLRSWAAYSSPDDALWTTLAYPFREWIVGNTSAPIGVYSAVPSPQRCEILVPEPDREDYCERGFPSYDPGPDLIEITGHLPDIGTGGLRRFQLRALLPYGEGEPETEERRVYQTLLKNGCPRRRIRAAIRLRGAGYVSRTTILSVIEKR